MYLSRPESRVTCGYAWQKQADALGAIPVEAAETCPFVRWPGFAWDSRRCGMVVEEARSRAGRRQVIARHPVGAVFECIETG